MGTETTKQLHSRLLMALANSPTPISYGGGGQPVDLFVLQAYYEFYQSGLVAGHLIQGDAGQAIAMGNMTITAKGRKYLEESAERKTSRWKVYAWFFGVLGTIAGGLLLVYYRKRIFGE